MRTLKKLTILTLSMCCVWSTLAFATDSTAEERSTNIVLSNNVQIEETDARVEQLQTAVASKISKYDLRDKITLPVYNQGHAGSCWAFTMKVLFEGTLRSTNNDHFELSAQHALFATSNNFLNGTYKYGLNRSALEDGADSYIGLGYLTNGGGPIQNKTLPYDDSKGYIDINEFNSYSKSEKKTEEWRNLGNIFKKNVDGKTEYYDITDEENYVKVNSTDVLSMRNKIKTHIMNYGPVGSAIVQKTAYFNQETSSYFYNSDATDEAHAITIIGWDDDYSKENFNPSHRPSSNGAYLVQNSYGKEGSGERQTYFYVSYEDTWIESYCYGIRKITDVDYDKIYQHDGQGANYAELLKDGTNEFWVASVFEKESNQVEFLNEVALTTLYNADYELYINPVNESLNGENVQKVSSSTSALEPGYHTIKLTNPLQLTGNKFAVIVKYKKATNKTFGLTYLTSKSQFGDDTYNVIKKEPGKCFYGLTQEGLKDLTESSSEYAFKTCIKAFTKNLEDQFDLSDKIKINSKDQGTSNNCWTMPINTVLETNRALKDMNPEEMSSKHMDYATSQSFKNGAINEFGYNRLANSPGTAEWGLSYFTNGSGPIYEMSMPFNNVFDRIDISEITNKTVMAKVEDWIMFPRVFKEITNSGIIYKNEKKEEYTQQELEKIRTKIKLHIMNNGAISTETYIEGSKEYYNPNTNAYYCDDQTKVVDHGVAIIGWDDNYPKENFKEGHQPEGDGAYIVQNSWGKDKEVAEKYYISYYDINVEKKLYGIVNTTEKDNAETIYQYDELGRNTSFSTEHNEVYGANVFTRNSKEEEYLKEISISTYCDMNYEVYINSANETINTENMKLVAKSYTPIENGYHTIKLKEPIKLTGDKFVVAVKYMGVDETLVSMQSKIISENGNSPYQNITSNEGESYVGVTLDSMKDLKQMKEIPEGNICIKAFTQKTNNTYSVLKGDINLDGHVTATDISLLKMHLVEIRLLKGYAFDAADINEDGKLSATDLALLNKIITNLI